MNSPTATAARECNPAEIAAMLRDSGRVLVFSHFHPDADAYGSSLALTHGLRAIGVDARCINQDGRSDRYHYIPGLDMIEDHAPASGGPWDTVVVCDCGDLNRVGEGFLPVIAAAGRVINIDHHASNPRYGTHALVRDTASSTAEIVFEILEELPGSMSLEAATCIYVGIAGDTGSFRYASTSARTFEIASRVVRLGVRADRISKAMFGSNTLPAVRLQSEAMSKMQIFNEGRVAEVVVTNEMYERLGATREDADNLVERARDIKGVCLSVLIKQDKDIWRISLRSVDPRYNVSEIASSLGGGGHKMAAAFRWSKGLDELRAALRARIDPLLGA